MSQDHKQHKNSVQTFYLRRAVILLLIGSMILLAVSSFAFAETNNYSLSSWTIDNGGGESIGGAYSVAGTIGQPDTAEPAVSPQYSVQGGFWPGVDDTTSPPINGHEIYLPALIR